MVYTEIRLMRSKIVILFCIFIQIAQAKNYTFSTFPGANGGIKNLSDKIIISIELKSVLRDDVIFKAKFKCVSYRICIDSNIIRLVIPVDNKIKTWYYKDTKFRIIGKSTIRFLGNIKDVIVLSSEDKGIYQLFYFSDKNGLLGFSSFYTDRPKTIWISEDENSIFSNLE